MVEGGKYRSIPTYNLPVAILEANPPTRSGTLMVPAGSSPVSVSTETAKEPAVMMSRPISAGTFHPASENLEAKSSVRFFFGYIAEIIGGCDRESSAVCCSWKFPDIAFEGPAGTGGL